MKWNALVSKRAWQEIEQADRVLFMVDGTTTDAVDPAEIWPEFIARLPAKLPITVVRNKADITGETLGMSEVNGHALIRLSARTGEGVDVLRNHLKQSMGFDTNMEGGFGAPSPLTGAGTGSGAFAAGKRNCWVLGGRTAGGRVAPGTAELKRNHRGVYL